MRVEIFHLSFGMYLKTTPSIITTEHGTTRFLQCHLIDSAYADHKTRSRPSAPHSQLVELADRFMSVWKGRRQAHGLVRCHLPDRRCNTCGSRCAPGTGCEREGQKSSLSVILRDTRKHGSIMLKRYNHASSGTFMRHANQPQNLETKHNSYIHFPVRHGPDSFRSSVSIPVYSTPQKAPANDARVV
ncbi:uncharacterized protein K489DRAFT_128600 [Dissoconium aciculare CBS 342.82]|uniref:Uncharacterized protein n=1 Tax=Dissoconium aciculare CBS 342.82 TaxID=1314786 RepID=A0A6J3LUI4_9PEZI|nr:uncharacterized protein K489DRAFT_128600 [Dissoconium aciculare CBS 342.82]KAF1818282.1 hypothetical protein K489DRAFT_128600 [Dissoconium aciculare CBS 342.82]